MKELVRYVEWFMSDSSAQDAASEQGMTPLGSRVLAKVYDNVLFKVTCNNKNMWDEVVNDKEMEKRLDEKWRLPVYIIAPFISVIMLSMTSYLMYVYVKTNRALMRNEWKVSSEHIQPINNFLSLTSQGFGSDVGSAHPSGYNPGRFTVALYKDDRVFLRPTSIKEAVMLSKETRRMLIWMKDSVSHANVMKLYGLTCFTDEYRIVSEFCSKGHLPDVLQSARYNLDDNFKFSMALDITVGMHYLHGLGLIHGELRSDVCFVDIRWNVKICDWEYHKLNSTQKRRKRDTIYPEYRTEAQSSIANDRDKLYYSPEKLRASTRYVATKADDFYSYGVIVYEIFTRDDAYSDLIDKMTMHDVLDSIATKYLRPTYMKEIPHNVFYVLEACWRVEPNTRLSFGQISKRLKKCNPTKRSLMDSMMHAIEAYTVQLEEKVTERTAALAQVTRNMEELLERMLPREIAHKLSRGESVEPEYFDAVTVFFSDIVGFTSLSAASTPLQVVNLLNHLYTHFDSIIENHGVYKVETIGDAYMVISGLPKRIRDHAAQIANMALEFTAQTFTVPHMSERQVLLRCGVASGSVMAGVVGLKMPRYCLFGDTVNTASRMESTSLPQRIQVCGFNNK